jgi:hypothetical protein
LGCVIIFETDVVDESAVLGCVIIFEIGVGTDFFVCIVIVETGDDFVIVETGNDDVDESAVIVETGVIDGTCLDEELFNSSLDPRGDLSLSIFEFNIDIFSFFDVKGRFFSNLSVILLYIMNIIYILVILY